MREPATVVWRPSANTVPAEWQLPFQVDPAGAVASVPTLRRQPSFGLRRRRLLLACGQIDFLFVGIHNAVEDAPSGGHRIVPSSISYSGCVAYIAST